MRDSAGVLLAVTCVVQARMGSTRLPGKVLAEVGGQPMLALMLDRLAPLAVDALVVATSDAAIDDPVAAVAAASGAHVVRGSVLDVLSRFDAALDAHPADLLVRLTADCPLADPAVVAEAIEAHRRLGSAYTSNTLVRTFPDGLDVEVVQASALRAAVAEAASPEEREHVTPFVYRRPHRFPLGAVRCEELLGRERWTVDTAEDLDFIRSVVAALPDRRAGWRAILEVAGRRSAAAPGTLELRPAGAADVGLGPWVAAHLEDPSVRTWVPMIDGRDLGWVRIAVRDGIGHLDLSLTHPEHTTDALIELQRALREDYQVVELTADRQEDEAAWLMAGFRALPAALRWQR